MTLPGSLADRNSFTRGEIACAAGPVVYSDGTGDCIDRSVRGERPPHGRRIFTLLRDCNVLVILHTHKNPVKVTQWYSLMLLNCLLLIVYSSMLINKRSHLIAPLSLMLVSVLANLASIAQLQ